MSCYAHGPWHRIEATVWIKDDTGADVEGATVYAEWTGDVPGPVSGTTGSDGKVLLWSDRSKNPFTGTCCVTDVVKTGYVYNPALNVETCDTNTCP